MTNSNQTPIEVLASDTSSQADEPKFRYASTEEVMAAFEKILPLHDAAFRELAKGPEGVVPHDRPPFDLKKW